MKTNIIKKITATVLSAATLFSAACISYGAYASDSLEETVITVESFGESGYENIRYVDENGNEIAEEPVISTQSTASLPETYDSREKGIITSVKDQGRSGNCWAFASTALMETGAVIEGIDTLETADYSEAHLVWFTHRRRVEDTADPTHGDGLNEGNNPYLTGGNTRKAAATLARWSGTANEESYPFYGKDLAAMGNYGESERYTTEGGAILRSWETLTCEADIKEWVMENGAISASYYHSDDYYNKENYSYFYPEASSTNHAIVIVGWDDNYSASNFVAAPDGDGAWLCKNSWGTHWGDEGYFWISYYDASIAYFEGYTVMAAEDYLNNYTYNGAPWPSAYGVSGAIQCANVFTAEGKEILSAISTITRDPGTSVKVSIYKNLPENYTNPTEGTLASYTETVIDNEGYHTIELETELTLEEGEIFSVVLEEKSSKSITFIPIEKGENYTSLKGQSFTNTKPGKNNWKDTYGTNYGNVYIQAITRCAHGEYETVTVESTCAETGSEKTVCTKCGKVESETVLPVKQHVYGEWSEYTHTEDGRTVATRSCTGCGKIQQNSYTEGNVVSLSTFLEMLFARIFEIFTGSFASAK